MAIAGKVAITPGGEWSVDFAYDKLVVVTFGNNVYLSIKPSTGIEPTNEEYWMLLIENVTQEQYDNIINGTTTVGNANKLGGKGASEYALDADLANYLPKSGGTIETTSVSPLFVKNTAIANSFIRYQNTEGGGYIGFRRGELMLADSSFDKVYNILHTGNKPTGSYTGNGSATTRTIATNGIGNFVLIFRGANSFALLSQAGYIAFNGTSVACGTDAYFSTGKIYISSTSETFNASGVNYEYQVL